MAAQAYNRLVFPGVSLPDLSQLRVVEPLNLSYAEFEGLKGKYGKGNARYWAPLSPITVQLHAWCERLALVGRRPPITVRVIENELNVILELSFVDCADRAECVPKSESGCPCAADVKRLE